MKLAEALQERADLNRKIEELRRRISQSLLTQEGEEPPEDPDQLIKELDNAADRLSRLTVAINHTNCVTEVNGSSLTEMIARKDMLALRLSAYRDMVHVAGQSVSRSRGTEIKILPVIKASELQRTADSIAKELRLLDNTLQESNWKTELIGK
ncbi:MAG: DIP1984 family protein [Oscillospiraceae bacterium]|nr:DIP1984 family protein [Oscillospiraceae bacterium]